MAAPHFDVVPGVFKAYFSIYLLIISLEYVLRTSEDQIKKWFYS